MPIQNLFNNSQDAAQQPIGVKPKNKFSFKKLFKNFIKKNDAPVQQQPQHYHQQHYPPAQFIQQDTQQFVQQQQPQHYPPLQFLQQQQPLHHNQPPALPEAWVRYQKLQQHYLPRQFLQQQQPLRHNQPPALPEAWVRYQQLHTPKPQPSQTSEDHLLAKAMLNSKMDGYVSKHFIGIAQKKVSELSHNKVKELNSNIEKSSHAIHKYSDEVKEMQSEKLFEILQAQQQNQAALAQKIQYHDDKSELGDILNFAHAIELEKLVGKELSSRQNVHDVKVENLTVELGGHIFHKTPSTETEAAQTLQEMRNNISSRLQKAASKEPAGFNQDKAKVNRKRLYAPPNETMRLQKALDFLNGDMIKSNSPIKISTPDGEKHITIAQLIASTIQSSDNPKMNWQEGLSDSKSRKEDLTDRMIDTLYENQRAHNMMDDDSDAIMDNMGAEDKISCLGGAANRVVVMASLFVNTAEKGEEEKLPLPGEGSYVSKFSEITNKTMLNLDPNTLSEQGKEKIKKFIDMHEAYETDESIIDDFMNIIKVRDVLKEEFPSLKQDGHKTDESNIWKKTKNTIVDMDLPKEFLEKFNKPQ